MKVTAVIERLAKGDSLRLGFSSGQRRWWFEGPYQVVPEHIFTRRCTTGLSP